MNYELERMWKEAVVPDLCGKTEENHETLSIGDLRVEI
jgi:hypothetical protein